MSGYQLKKRKLTAEINVVPYIDVMLVLLIIFMATATVVSQAVEVELPTASSSAPTQASNSAFIIVEVDKNGQLGFSANNEEVKRGLALQDIIVRVRAERSLHPDVQVAVGGDSATPYAEIVLVLDALSQAGIAQVGLLTDTE